MKKKFPHNLSTGTLIVINVWSRGLLFFLIPFGMLGLFAPFYGLYEIEKNNDFQLNALNVLLHIYKTNTAVQKMTWFILPAIICVFFARWTNKKLNSN